MQILFSLIIGGVAGWIAGLIVNDQGSGIIINIIVGIIGAAIGNAILRAVDQEQFNNNWVGQLLTAILGAAILLAGLNILF